MVVTDDIMTEPSKTRNNTTTKTRSWRSAAANWRRCANKARPYPMTSPAAHQAGALHAAYDDTDKDALTAEPIKWPWPDA